MKIDSAFLSSKVGQRIFFLFAVCALLPITVLALVSFRSVTRELQEQSERQLHRLTVNELPSRSPALEKSPYSAGT